MPRGKIVALALMLLLGLASTPADAQRFPERGRSAVVDAADVIPDAAEAALEARLVAWSRETGHQLVVATLPDLQGYPIADYAVGLLRHWRLGRAGVNDGVLLLLVPGERRVRIEVGYGLEPVLTDALASRIISETIRPKLGDGDIAGALADGAERIMTTVSPPVRQAAATPAPAPGPQAEDGFGAGVAVGIVIGLGIIVGILYLIGRAGRRRDRVPADGPVDSGRSRDERRYATVPRAEARPPSGRKGSPAAAHDRYTGPDPLQALSERAQSYDGGYDGSYDGGGDAGFDGGGGSGGGGGADSSY